MWKICNKNSFIVIIVLLSIIYYSGIALCEITTSGFPVPRFVSTKSSETNLRSGPGDKYEIILVYKARGYPLEVIAEFQQWRLVKDDGNNQGWVHQSLISGFRYFLITNNVGDYKSRSKQREALVFRLPEEGSRPIFRIEFSTLVKAKKCMKDWCQIEIEGKKGWIRKANIWGVYDYEIF